ncbi:hypothetical protein OpiT1DRAFT_04376 [Opitutaceae bacterium TAV1]|nr:hypothetical protein OpiT1DRAFT_04376 [Opitutaceae bacterium TAV1]
MKKTALFIAALVASGSVYAQAQQSTAPAIDFTFDATVVNEYIWRGQELADWTFHPSLKATYGDAYLGVWSAMPFNQTSGTADWTEFDFFGGYKFALNDNWSLDAGVTFYTYTDTPGSNPNSVEPYLGISGKVADLLSTSFYVFHNFEYNATTLQGSIGYSLPLEKLGTSLDFSATLGWVSGNSNLREAGDNIPGLSDYFYWSIGVAAPYKISDRAVLTVGVSYNDVNENDINSGADFVGSASLTIGF